MSIERVGFKCQVSNSFKEHSRFIRDEPPETEAQSYRLGQAKVNQNKILIVLFCHRIISFYKQDLRCGEH